MMVKARARTQPAGVGVLALLTIISGIIILLLGFLMFISLVSMGTKMRMPMFYIIGIANFFTFLLFGSITTILGWGLWFGKKWAWWITVILLGIIIVFAPASILQGNLSGSLFVARIGNNLVTAGSTNISSNSLAALLTLIIALITLWYMFRPHVRSYFGVSVRYPASPPPPPPPQA
jgi:lysylphosphatidylglycerol synthetase-like protein (DUF2156 family)